MTKQSIKIGVIVLNYNGSENTLECVKSLKQAKKHLKEVEIIVVDNNSVDNSVSHLSKIEGISLITNKENLGYSGGNNTGIKYALKNHCNCILVINNDTYVDEFFFQKILIGLQMSDIVAPKIYFAPGFEYHKSRYAKTDLGKVIWYAGGRIDWENIIGEHVGVDEVDVGQFEKIENTDFATGACMFAKKEVFEKIGMFDEKYFLYLEDMDFCVRAKNAGMKITFFPEAIMWHKNAASSGGSGSKLQDYYITRNRLIFAFKFAKLKTKLAVLKQVAMQAKSLIKRDALIDFITFKFGKRDRDFMQ